MPNRTQAIRGIIYVLGLAGINLLVSLAATLAVILFHSMPPYWWHPSITERTRVLSTPSFPLHERGPDGWHALATWDPDDELLHVWIKNNF